MCNVLCFWLGAKLFISERRTVLCAHSLEPYSINLIRHQWSSIKFVVYEHLEQHEKHLLSTKSCNANQVLYISEGQGILQTESWAHSFFLDSNKSFGFVLNEIVNNVRTIKRYLRNPDDGWNITALVRALPSFDKFHSNVFWRNKHNLTSVNWCLFSPIRKQEITNILFLNRLRLKRYQNVRFWYNVINENR